MQRLADLLRTVPGVARHLEGLERQSFGMRPTLMAIDVLADDAALNAWKEALEDATCPT